MVVSGFFFSGLGVSIRMASQDVHVFETVFFRNFFQLVIMLPWLMKIGFKGLRTEHLKLHALRSATGVCAMFMWFWGFAFLPLAEATSLGFTAPLWATLGAIIILGETVRLRRWMALIIGFTGTLIILRPGLEAISTPALLVLGGSVFVAGSTLCVKTLSNTESPNTMVLYMAMFMVPVSLIPLPFVWTMPSATGWMWLFGTGFFATFGHLCFNRAFIDVDASAVLPFEYSRLIIIAVIAFAMFSEIPDIWVWVGGAVIFGASIYIAHREAKAAKISEQRQNPLL